MAIQLVRIRYHDPLRGSVPKVVLIFVTCILAEEASVSTDNCLEVVTNQFELCQGWGQLDTFNH